MTAQRDAPDGSSDEHSRRTAHVAAAARAQAAAAARARANADGRDRTTSTEAERTGAYAGLVTRAIAYSLDIVALNLVSLLVGVAVGLAASLVPDLPSSLDAVTVVVLGLVYAVWVIGYFVTFWATTGQTPGSRLMRIKVIDARGEPRIKPRRAIVRFVGLVLATIPLFAGFLIMLWDDRRRCLQDRMARTTVVHAPPQPRIVRQAIPRGRD